MSINGKECYHFSSNTKNHQICILIKSVKISLIECILLKLWLFQKDQTLQSKYNNWNTEAKYDIMSTIYLLLSIKIY